MTAFDSLPAKSEHIWNFSRNKPFQKCLNIKCFSERMLGRGGWDGMAMHILFLNVLEIICSLLNDGMMLQMNVLNFSCKLDFNLKIQYYG